MEMTGVWNWSESSVFMDSVFWMLVILSGLLMQTILPLYRGAVHCHNSGLFGYCHTSLSKSFFWGQNAFYIWMPFILVFATTYCHLTAFSFLMLQEGVQKFSTMVNKNLPWRKILEFGRHVFDGTRTPADLKDKWRNILVKECSTK